MTLLTNSVSVEKRVNVRQVPYLWPAMLWILVAVVSTTTTTTLADKPPEFVTNPESSVVKLGSPVTLSCTVDPQDSQIGWLFDGHQVQSDQRIGITVSAGILRIDAFTASKDNGGVSHVGKYQCVAKNGLGTVVSKEAELDKASLRHFEVGEPDIYVNASKGNVAVIPCYPPKANPPALTRFEIDGSAVDHGNKKRHRLLPSGSLQIADVRESDQGVYRCVAYNSVSGKDRTAPNVVHLTVTSPVTDSMPRFIRKPANTQVTQGQNLTLECLVEGSPVPIVTWDKYGGDLPTDRYAQVLGNLVIYDVRMIDQGTYICHTENGVGLMRTEIASVEVLERPSVRISPPSKDEREGGHVTFHCHTRGYLRMQGEWLYNGQPVVQDEFITITDTELTIDKVKDSHDGIYQCVGRSKDESAYASAWLRVTKDTEMSDSAAGVGEEDEDEDDKEKEDQNVPTVASAPQNNVRNTTARPPPRRSRPREGNGNRGQDPEEDVDDEDGDGDLAPNDPDNMVPPSRPDVRKLNDQSVMLIWAVPVNSGLEITFFKVQYREMQSGAKKGWVTQEEDIDKDTTRHEVSGLTPGDYKFRVLAVFSNNDNKQGPSRRFTLSRGPSPAPPPPLGIPMIVVVEQLSSTALGVQWHYDAMDSAIEGFFIFHKPYHSQSKYKRDTFLQPVSREYVVDGLQPNTEYSFMIKSFNTAGESEFSYPVVQKTLSTNGLPATDSPFIPNMKPLTTTKKTIGEGEDEEDDSVYRPPRPKSSNDTLYMVLGIVLGVMLLVLLVFMVMCWWKQRQQRRHMAALDERNKFHDPSRVIYNDSLSKKPQTNGGSHFLLNGINGTNGRISNGHGPPRQHVNGNMNINMNPMTDLDAESKEHYSLQELRSSLQEVLQQPPPPPPPGGVMDSNCNSMHRSCHSPHDNFYEEVDNVECCDCDHHHHHHHHHQHCQDGCHGNQCDSGPFYPPPNYNSFSSFNKSRGGNNNRSHDHHNGSHDPRVTAAAAAGARTMSPDHIPRSFERPYRSNERPHDPCRHERGSGDHVSEHSLSSSSHASGRPKRRRRRDSSEEDSSGAMRDQATNTDISSNEGTLDSHHGHNHAPNLPYTPRENGLPENDGGREGHDPSDLQQGRDPCDPPDPYYHHPKHHHDRTPSPHGDNSYVDYEGESPDIGESPSYADYEGESPVLGESPPSENSPCLEEVDNVRVFPHDLPRANDYSESENEEDPDNQERDVFIRR